MTAAGGQINSVELRGRRRPRSRIRPMMPIVRHCRGCPRSHHRRAGARRAPPSGRRGVADRLVNDPWAAGDASRTSSSTASPSHRHRGRRRPVATASRTIERHPDFKAHAPDVQTTLGRLQRLVRPQPAGRVVLNSVFLHECVDAGPSTPRSPRVGRSCRWRASPTSSAGRARPGLRPAPPVRRRGQTRGTTRWRASSSCSGRAGRRRPAKPAPTGLLTLPLDERLQRRIVDGERKGLEDDLEEALRDPAGARDRQRHAARGHEDRGRPVRPRRDAGCRSCCRAPRS